MPKAQTFPEYSYFPILSDVKFIFFNSIKNLFNDVFNEIKNKFYITEYGKVKIFPRRLIL